MLRTKWFTVIQHNFNKLLFFYKEITIIPASAVSDNQWNANCALLDTLSWLLTYSSAIWCDFDIYIYIYIKINTAQIISPDASVFCRYRMYAHYKPLPTNFRTREKRGHRRLWRGVFIVNKNSVWNKCGTKGDNLCVGGNCKYLWSSLPSVIVRHAGLMRSQQDFEWWWSVPLSSALLY